MPSHALLGGRPSTGFAVGGPRRSAAVLVVLSLMATLIAVVAWPRPAAAALPTNFQEKAVISGLTRPTAVRFAPDGRVFVAEKSGIIKLYSSLTDTTPEIYADLRRQVFNGWDRGMLGMALHPKFPVDPRVYVMYTYNGPLGGPYPKWPSSDGSNDNCPDPPGANNAGCVVAGRISVLSQASPAAGALATRAEAGPVTEKVLLEDWCQQFSSHSVGTLAFGRDGALYASGGDGASFGYADWGQKNNACGDPPGRAGTGLKAPSAEGGALRAQDLRTTRDPTTLDGTIIRINPDTGKAAAGNPATTGDDNARRIVAYGLRNPYRFTLRPGNDEIWAGDVGWTTWEEVNRHPDPTRKVRNFGWPCYEGNGRTKGYDAANLTVCENLYRAGSGSITAPHFVYNHANKIVSGEACGTGSSSTSGMAFYSGTVYPKDYRGALFFTDYARKCVWVMKPGTNGVPDKTKISTFATGSRGIVDLQAGPNGDIFAVDVIGGAVVRYTYHGVNNPPVAAIKSDVTSGNLPLAVQFDGSTSSDADGNTPLTYAWDLDGDGAYDDSTTAKPTHTYTAKGRYTVGLRVTDTRGATDTSTLVITAGSTPPTVRITRPGTDLRWAVGDRVEFAAEATDAEDGALTGDSLEWEIIMHHCPSNCHTHTITGQNGAGGEFTAPDHENPSWIELKVTARDADGLTATRSVELHPKVTKVTLQSSPAGVPLTLFETTRAAPFDSSVITGSTVSIAAPTQRVMLGDVPYEFVGWSDGGASAHNITPTQDVTLTATYRKMTNLAQGKGSKVSSVEATGREGPKAFDGSTTTRWASKHSDPQWIEVDLGSVRKVGFVLLNWEAAYGKAYQVQISTGGGRWTTVHSRTNGNGMYDWVGFTPADARWVRMYGTQRVKSTYGYSLWEMEVYEK